MWFAFYARLSAEMVPPGPKPKLSRLPGESNLEYKRRRNRISSQISKANDKTRDPEGFKAKRLEYERNRRPRDPEYMRKIVRQCVITEREKRRTNPVHALTKYLDSSIS